MEQFWRVRAPEPSREGLSLMEIMKLAAVAGDGDLWTCSPGCKLLDAAPTDVNARLHSAWPETVELCGVLTMDECSRIRETLDLVPGGMHQKNAYVPGKCLPLPSTALQDLDLDERLLQVQRVYGKTRFSSGWHPCL